MKDFCSFFVAVFLYVVMPTWVMADLGPLALLGGVPGCITIALCMYCQERDHRDAEKERLDLERRLCRAGYK